MTCWKKTVTSGVEISPFPKNPLLVIAGGGPHVATGTPSGPGAKREQSRERLPRGGGRAAPNEQNWVCNKNMAVWAPTKHSSCGALVVAQKGPLCVVG